MAGYAEKVFEACQKADRTPAELAEYLGLTRAQVTSAVGSLQRQRRITNVGAPGRGNAVYAAVAEGADKRRFDFTLLLTAWGGKLSVPEG